MSSPPYVLRLELAAADLGVCERLTAAYPQSRRSGSYFEVPLDGIGPEEVLAACCAARIRVVRSILAPSGSAG